MKISRLGEFGLIKKIRKSAARSSPSVLIGIGDDAAALKVTSSTLLVTTDMLIEGVHFDLAYTDFYSLGWKSAAVNLSDIAAMGGSAGSCLISLGIPVSVSVKDISEFYRGCSALLDRHGGIIVGGDTCSSGRGMIVSVVMTGTPGKRGILTRSGAKPGDRLFVTGTLGDSAAGLELLRGMSATRGAPFDKRRQNAITSKRPSSISELIERHLKPVPRLEWAEKIGLAGYASAMIDVSDGLSSDLYHLCEQSGVGAVLFAENIPLSRSLRESSHRLEKSGLRYALSGGEDYELLFTVPVRKAGDVSKLPLPATEIGEMTRSKNINIIDSRGKPRPLRSSGFDHFISGKSATTARQRADRRSPQ